MKTDHTLRPSFPFTRQMLISRLAITCGIILVVAMAAVAGVRQYTSQTLQIGGTLYNRIIVGKDFVGDLMPPPLFLVEAYLEAHETDSDRDNLAVHRANLERRKAAYVESRDKWFKGELPEALKTGFAVRSNAEAEKFWSIVFDRLLPAAEKKDDAAQDVAMKELSRVFAAHKAIVVEVVKEAETYLRDAEVSAQKSVAWLSNLALGMTVLTLAMLTGMVVGLRHVVTTPLAAIAERTRQLADGDLSSPIPFTQNGNEIGHIAKALEVFKASAEEKVRVEQAVEAQRAATAAEQKRVADEQAHAVTVVAEAMRALAEGDLTTRITKPIGEGYDALKRDFNASVEELEAVVGTVKTGAGSIRSGTIEIAQASDDLARRTETQAANLEQTTAAVTEITAAVAKSAEGASKAREIAASAKTEAERGGAVVASAVTSMADIEKSSKEISQIIGVIDEIAFQTNLLALNAGVEAARAGDAGRGFAVVASEVRALAQRSAEAARQIKGLISTSSTQVEQGVKLVRESGFALDKIVESVADINSAITEIAQTAECQSNGLQEVNAAINQMDQVTQQNAAMVEESTAAARALAQQTDELERLVSGLTTKTTEPLRAELRKVVPHVFADRVPNRVAPVKSAPRVKSLGSRIATAPSAVAVAQHDEGWEDF